MPGFNEKQKKQTDAHQKHGGLRSAKRVKRLGTQCGARESCGKEL